MVAPPDVAGVLRRPVELNNESPAGHAVTTNDGQPTEIRSLLIALDHDLAGVSIFDRFGNLQYANRAFSRAYDISHDRLKRQPTLKNLQEQLVSKGLTPEMAKNCLVPSSEGASRQSQFSVVLPSGKRVRIQHIPDGNGGWVTRHMMTEQVQLPSSTASELVSLQTLIDQVPDYLWVKDLQGRFVVVNKALALDSGKEQSTDLIGMSDEDLHEAQRAQQFRARELEILETGNAMIDEEELIIDADGNQKVFSSSKIPLRGDNDQVVGLIGVARDISSRKKAEELRLRAFELEETSRQLEKALDYERKINAQQRQFVSMASHEFRTPLAIIDGAAQRLLRRMEGVEQSFVVEKAHQIRNAVSRVVELMESILSFERLESGVATIKREEFNIHELLTVCCERQKELSDDHEFSVDLCTLPKTLVGDKLALEQVFTNLLSNAAKYSPGSSLIEVRGWLDGTVAYISVRDQGVGMDSEDAPRIFERFFRARTATGIPGTGIGLHLVKQIVELHGGRVAVESEIGTGSVFTVSLPAQ